MEWGKDDYDNVNLIFLHGGYGSYGGHSHALVDAFYHHKVLGDLNLVEYLKSCGFDIATLKFSIQHSDPRARDGSPVPHDLSKKRR